ncbi:MAG TPA: hypothetical protein VL572_01290, partial [Pyrinomonadaceae bacterium]|nr:hypothetical protein [Pyrinomonadaceae bacterium]
MERHSEGSTLNTMRGKVLTMIAVLAVINAVIGLAVFVSGSLLIAAVWIPAVTALIAITATTVVFA